MMNNALDEDLQRVIEKFRKFPKNMEMGAGKLARRYKTTAEVIRRAKGVIRAETIPFYSKTKVPKILLLDIETAPIKSFIWGLWNNDYVDYKNILSDWFMLAWSAKWLFDPVTHGSVLTPDEVKEESDVRLCAEIHNLLDQADIVIAHNGDRFDIPKINARFLLNGFTPPSFYRTIDTKKIAKGVFQFSSNRLDYLAHAFGLQGKIKTDFNLWKRCMNGDENALDEMLRYNLQDVSVLEEVYLKLRPWMKSHPNLSLYMEITEPVCAHCGSKHLTDRGFYYTNTGRFKAYQCDDCGAISRSRQNDLPKEEKRIPLVSIPSR